MHLTCTNNPVKLTGMFGRFEVRNLSEVFMRPSSDAAQTTVLSWRHLHKIRLRKPYRKKSGLDWKLVWNSTWRFLGWASSHYWKIGRYVTVISRDISTNLDPLRWVISQGRGWPPCCKWVLTRDKLRKIQWVSKMAAEIRSFTSFQMVHTHTHPRTHTHTTLKTQKATASALSGFRDDQNLMKHWPPRSQNTKRQNHRHCHVCDMMRHIATP